MRVEIPGIVRKWRDEGSPDAGFSAADVAFLQRYGPELRLVNVARLLPNDYPHGVHKNVAHCLDSLAALMFVALINAGSVYLEHPVTIV